MFGVVLVFVSLANSAAAQAPPKARLEGDTTVTLLAINKYQGQRTGCLRLGAVPDCQLRYGSLYAGNDWDWFESAAGEGNRTVIKDLGLLSWADAFKVPFVEPLPKLKPGEQRHIVVDTSGQMARMVPLARVAKTAPMVTELYELDQTRPLLPILTSRHCLYGRSVTVSQK
jgi:hypothetical protein